MTTATPKEVFYTSVTTKAGKDLRALSVDGRHLCDVRVYDEKDSAALRLFSAAPDLLAAAIWAEAAIAPFSKDPAEKSGISMLRAAIAKASQP